MSAQTTSYSNQQPQIDELRNNVEQLRTVLSETRAAVVEQEHRLIPILTNFFIARRSWPVGDPRRDAALRAVLVRIFFSLRISGIVNS